MDENKCENKTCEDKEKVAEVHINENEKEVSKEKGIRPRKPYVMTEARKKALEKANEKKAQNIEIRRRVEEKYNKIKEDLQTVYDYNLNNLEKEPQVSTQPPPASSKEEMPPKIENKTKEKKKKKSKPPPPSSSSESESQSEEESEEEEVTSSSSEESSESEEEVIRSKKRKKSKAKKTSRKIKHVHVEPVQYDTPPPSFFRSTGALPRSLQRGF